MLGRGSFPIPEGNCYRGDVLNIREGILLLKHFHLQLTRFAFKRNAPQQTKNPPTTSSQKNLTAVCCCQGNHHQPASRRPLRFLPCTFYVYLLCPKTTIFSRPCFGVSPEKCGPGGWGRGSWVWYEKLFLLMRTWRNKILLFCFSHFLEKTQFSPFKGWWTHHNMYVYS